LLTAHSFSQLKCAHLLALPTVFQSIRVWPPKKMTCSFQEN
jgi:hypothetical protein